MTTLLRRALPLALVTVAAAQLGCGSDDDSSTLAECSDGTHDIPSFEMASELCGSLSSECTMCERQLDDAGMVSSWSVFEYACRCPGTSA